MLGLVPGIHALAYASRGWPGQPGHDVANGHKKSRLRKRRGRVYKNPDCDSESFDGTPSVPQEEAKASTKRQAKAKPAQGRQPSPAQRPMGLHLRRRQGGGPLRHEGPARRQGRQPRRDGQPRPAGAAGLHHHHRGLHALLRQRQQAIRRSWRRRSTPALAHIAQHHRHGSSATRDNPLLVSVRSGARASMPGMMDTVLNLGLNDETVEALAQAVRRPRASPTTATAASSRCIPTWCSASSITTSRTSSRTTRTRNGYTLDTELTADDWAT